VTLVTRELPIRARVRAGREAPFDRLFDPLVDDLLRDGPVARQRFATRWTDTSALTDLARRKRRPISRALAAELTDYHRRLGATAASLRSIERLAAGEVTCAVAGQQPAPLLGPLYSLHKTASAVGLSRSAEARTGVACVPLFWMHGEDSDFAEIRGATVFAADLAVHDLELPAHAHRGGGLVGSIPRAPLEAVHEAASRVWAGLPAHDAVQAMLARALERGRDLGEVTSALMLDLFGAQGLVVIDPRLDAFRAEASPILHRYLDHADRLHAAVRDAGAWLEANAGRRPLADSSLDSFVFAIEDGERRKQPAAEARAHAGRGGALSPSVALRPVVQDAVFPTVAMACGAGELSYLLQLREVFETLEVPAASAVMRLSATWLPPAAAGLLEAAGGEAWSVVVETDAVIRRLADRAVPVAVREQLEAARRASNESLDRFADASQQVDPSLPQMVESARGKIDFQFARLVEGVTGKARHRLERRHPEWARLRYVLFPGDRLQERRVSSLQPLAHRGLRVVDELCDLAVQDCDRLAGGVYEHLLLDL
jgi:uncharacterized protein YllA (UPF0747 family)